MNDSFPSDWKASNKPITPDHPLHGEGLPVVPESPLAGSEPITPEMKARAAATEKLWLDLRDAPVALSDLILFINAHPELLAWAVEYGARLNVTPGKTP